MMSTAATAIEQDLTCGGCDYNLRGLPCDGACPECGHGVTATIAGFSAARGRWLQRVATGSLLIGAGVLVGGTGLLMAPENGRWLLGAFSAAAVIAATGSWMFASGEGRRANGIGIALRVAGTATVVLQLGVLSTFATANGVLSGVPVVAPRHVIGLCETTAVVWGVAAILTCVRAAALARRFDDAAGAAQAAFLGLLAACTFFVGVAVLPSGSSSILPHVVLSAVHAGWSIIFFLGFSIVLRRRARTMTPRPL
jgi:hypothetical protein